MTSLVAQSIFVIGELGPGDSNHMTLQNFIIDGETMIPIFWDEVAFKEQTAGSGFSDRGIEITLEAFCSVMRGDEIFILNPGTAQPTRLSANDLRKMALEQQ